VPLPLLRLWLLLLLLLLLLLWWLLLLLPLLLCPLTIVIVVLVIIGRHDDGALALPLLLLLLPALLFDCGIFLGCGLGDTRCGACRGGRARLAALGTAPRCSSAVPVLGGRCLAVAAAAIPCCRGRTLPGRLLLLLRRQGQLLVLTLAASSTL
jgi:hypothetical protein